MKDVEELNYQILITQFKDSEDRRNKIKIMVTALLNKYKEKYLNQHFVIATGIGSYDRYICRDLVMNQYRTEILIEAEEVSTHIIKHFIFDIAIWVNM